MLRTNNSYVERCINAYLRTWRSNGYVKKDGQPVKYKEHLMELDENIRSLEVTAEVRLP